VNDMNPDYEKKLESAVDRALKAMPPLESPGSLLPRVMATLQKSHALPWYHQPWTMWSQPMRLASLGLLIAAVSALFYLGFEFSRLEGVAALGREVGSWFSGVSALISAVGVLLNAVILVAKHLGTGFIFGCVLALALGYGLCMGLGSLWFRVALYRK